MPIRYRLKRNSGPVHEPIPAHPDAIYRPQNRPTPPSAPPIGSGVIAPRLLANNPMVAAPLVAGGSSFSPWWIIGPLLALLAAMALAGLMYALKKKQNPKEEAEEEENNPEKRNINNLNARQNKEENPDYDDDDDDNENKLPFENVPLRTMKSDTLLEEQKRTMPMSSTAKDNSPSNTNPLLFSDVKKEPFDKSALLAHDLPLIDDSSTVPSAHPDSTSSLSHYSPANVTQMRKSNSDKSKHSNVENTSTSAPTDSPLKNIRSSSINPTSSTTSHRSKLGQSNDGLESETNTLKPTIDLNKKEKNPNDLKQAFGEKTVFDHMEPSKTGEENKEYPLSSSSHTGLNDPNELDDDHINQLNSPQQHGIGKSPLISNIPTGSKYNSKRQSRSRTNQTEEQGKNPSKSSLSNPDLQQLSSKENTYLNKAENPSSSDTNKDKQSSTLIIDSKHDPSSELKKKPSSNSIISNESISKQTDDPYLILNKTNMDKFGSRHIDSFTKGLDLNPSDTHSQSHIDSSNPQKSNKPNDDKSVSLMPNVPQCKTNNSSDDDDYDDICPIPSKQSNSNSNKNASTYRKNRSSHLNKSHTKDKKIFHFNVNDKQ